MKLKPLLQDVDFGEEAAESDRRLSQYFIETSSFIDVVNNRVDLLLGEKGSGKTAIFRHLADRDASIPELKNVDVLPAFNVEGSVIFRNLCEHGDLTEEALRITWMAFVVALIGTHLVRTYDADIDVRALKKGLKRAGLLAATEDATGVWGGIEHVIGRLARRIEVDGKLAVSAPQLPVKASARWRWLPIPAIRPATVNLEHLLKLEIQALDLLGRQVWILFDRLDEAFSEDRDLESRALRALLRAHLDIVSYGQTVRTKLCLRTDVLQRITLNAGFVNATHLRRHYIRWDRDGIVDLLARRLVARDQFARFYEIERAHMQTRHGRHRVCLHMLPSDVEDTDVFGWLERRTTDGHGALNPRNIVSLLGLARNHQLVAYDRDDPEFEHARPLISADAMCDAFRDLSSKRLDDMVLAEFSHLRTAVDALRKKPARISRQDLLASMPTLTSDADLEDVVQGLTDAGVLCPTNADVVTVSLLYRPALGSQAKRSAKKISNEERRELRQGIDEAAEEAIANSGASVLREVDPRQADDLAEYMRSTYPTLVARVMPGGSHALPNLELSLERPVAHRRVGPRAPDERTEPVVDLDEVRAMLGQLIGKILDGEAVAVSEPLGPRARGAIELLERREPRPDNIRLIGSASRRGSYRAIFARDVPGSSVGEREHALEIDAHADLLRANVARLVALVADESVRVQLRPMGPRAVAEAIAIVSRRDDVTFRLRESRGGATTGLVLLPVS